MIASTRSPEALCEPAALLHRCVSLAVLEAILSPDWESRYYSFDGAWGDDTLMASMRNGSGDDVFIAFGVGGVFIKGFGHEMPMARQASGRGGDVWPGIYDGLPASLACFRDEPAFSCDSVTFCLWWEASRPGWRVGVQTFAEGPDPDGSEWLLAIYDGKPETYAAFAADYYEVDVPIDAVAAIYRQEPLTKELVARLNPNVSRETVIEESADWPYGAAR